MGMLLRRNYKDNKEPKKEVARKEAEKPTSKNRKGVKKQNDNR